MQITVYHIYPEHDVADHLLHCELPGPVCHCSCEPMYEHEGMDSVIVRHRPFGEKAVDLVKEILSNDISANHTAQHP